MLSMGCMTLLQCACLVSVLSMEHSPSLWPLWHLVPSGAFFVGLCVEPLVVMAFVLLHIDFELRGAKRAQPKIKSRRLSRLPFGGFWAPQWIVFRQHGQRQISPCSSQQGSIRLVYSAKSYKSQLPRASGQMSSHSSQKISLPQRQIRMFANTAINMAGKTGLPLKMKSLLWAVRHPTGLIHTRWPAVVHPFSSDALCSICLDSRTPIT